MNQIQEICKKYGGVSVNIWKRQDRATLPCYEIYFLKNPRMCLIRKGFGEYCTRYQTMKSRGGDSNSRHVGLGLGLQPTTLPTELPRDQVKLGFLNS